MISSGHLQTLAAFLMPCQKSEYRAAKHIVPLYDGDRLVIHDDKPTNWITGDRIVIIVHGLCGQHLSPYVVRTSDKLHRRGVRTIRIDLRGAGESTLISRLPLNGGCYRDLVSVVDYVHRLSPLSRIGLVGFSLGGNIVLKTLGVWGADPPGHVDSAVAVSPPIDMLHCSWNLRQGSNRWYESYFVKQFKRKHSLRRRMVKDSVDGQINPLPSRLIHWDDQITAPCWGYRGAREYYEDCSSGPLLDRVSVPTVILATEDDPVVPHEMFGDFLMSDFIELVSMRHGGHLGFIGQGARDPDRYWMDWRVCDWVTSLDNEI